VHRHHIANPVEGAGEIYDAGRDAKREDLGRARAGARLQRDADNERRQSNPGEDGRSELGKAQREQEAGKKR
jgi:hypothetical protein